jgi:hypothetical protein
MMADRGDERVIPGRTPVVLFPNAGGWWRNRERGTAMMSSVGRFLISTAPDESAASLTLIQDWKPPGTK